MPKGSASPSESEPQRLFVYGSLAPGESNERILQTISGSWEPASLRGMLVEAGWGAGIGYPALLLDDSADPIPGQIFTSESLEHHWKELDAFEGEEYERVLAQAQWSDGTPVTAFVYVLRENS